MMRRGCPAGSSSTHATLEGLRRKKRRQYAGVDDTASNKQRHQSPSRTLTRRDPSIRPLDFPFGRCGIGTGKTSPAAFLPFAPSSSSSLLLSSIQLSICFHHHVILLPSPLSIPALCSYSLHNVRSPPVSQPLGEARFLRLRQPGMFSSAVFIVVRWPLWLQLNALD